MADTRFFRSSSTGRPTEFGAIFPPSDSWLTSTSEEPVLDPSLPIVDSHHHLWERPYPYLPHDLVADAVGHNVIGTVFVECANDYRSGGPESLRPVGETEKVVARTRAGDNTRPRVAAGIVGFADLTLGAEVGAVLDEHVAYGDGRFRGVRFSTGWDPSPAVENTAAAKRPHMLAEPRIRAGLAEVSDRDLTYDAWLFHTQLQEVTDLADALPRLRIVLNHCGGPLGYGPYATGRNEHFAAWRDSLRDLARRSNVVCKLGGLLARGAAFDYLSAKMPPTSAELARIWGPWIHECIDAFGSHRCMFESNFPVEKMGVSYTALWNAFKLITADASPDERTALFAHTAVRTYQLQPAIEPIAPSFARPTSAAAPAGPLFRMPPHRHQEHLRDNSPPDRRSPA